MNELPSWSPWPARIVGLQQWSVPTRNLDKITAEYNNDKYAKLLYWVETQKDIPLEEAERRVISIVGLSPEKQICISRRQELFVTTARDAFEKLFQELRSAVGAVVAGCRSVVELGCGCGLNLWHLKQTFSDLEFAGADFSANAVTIARRFGQKVSEFNFYDESTYSFLERCPRPIAVFTSHALEQLPTATPFVKNLGAYRDRIKAVLHFEPVRDLHGQDLLGLLRARYTEINDYNRDLLATLRSAREIEIDRVEYDVIGVNPLNPSSVIQWHFR